MRTPLFFSTLFFLCVLCTVEAKDYKASFFGIKSNGTTLNTTSIQKAIDHIHENGGGRLVFYVGRYLTGTIYLKSDVTLHLEEGAVLVGSENPFDYDRHGYWTALIFAFDQQNIGITGKGVIDGQGYKVANNILDMVHRGVIKDPNDLLYDRPREGIRPQNIYFKGCKQVTITGITLKDPGSWNQQYDQCSGILVDDITVDSKSYWNNDGIDIVDCDGVVIKNSYFDAADDGICLKSHDANKVCNNVVIKNNVVRSSASGIKFGTASRGGFKNIKIINNTVYDTYRSAITFAAVDGGFIENVLVDSLRAYNTGNPIFLRIGERKPPHKGRLENIVISNFYAEVPANKPDAGYRFEGPVEDLPRNISPSVITGMPDAPIKNLLFKNVEFRYPGGGDSLYAKVNLNDLDKIPELPKKYPEFSMFKELPAWGFYLRHVQGVRFENLRLVCKEKDYRRAIVLDDVHNANFKSLGVQDPVQNREPIYEHQSSAVLVE